MAEEKTLETTIAGSAMRQIHNAIDLFHKSQLDSAITLAHAAEGMLPTTDKPNLFQKQKALADNLAGEPGAIGPNDFANWLKHGEAKHKKYSKAFISELEAITAITRAISQYIAINGGMTPQMGGFRDWAIKHVEASDKTHNDS